MKAIGRRAARRMKVVGSSDTDPISEGKASESTTSMSTHTSTRCWNSTVSTPTRRSPAA